MDNSSNQDKDDDEGMTLDYKPSTPDPPNTNQVIYSNDEMQTTETLLEDYCEAKIAHNHLNFHMIWGKVKEECRALHTSIDLFKKTKLPYS